MTATRPSIGSLYVGASGFSYPGWKRGFYPPGTPPRDFLRFYAERLRSVELNSTFYNLPSESTVASWVEATPSAFRFAVKMSRRATQFGNVGAAAELCERMRGLGERLGPIRIVLTRARDDGWLGLLVASLDPSPRVRLGSPPRVLGGCTAPLRRPGRRARGRRALPLPPLSGPSVRRRGARADRPDGGHAARAGRRRLRVLPSRGRTDRSGLRVAPRGASANVAAASRGARRRDECVCGGGDCRRPPPQEELVLDPPHRHLVSLT